jgi:hypothetical protein
MSKPTDFSKLRRDQGRALRKLVRNLESIARECGIDLSVKQTAKQGSQERKLLAERLQESVVPLFLVERRAHPDRIGSCVLVRLDSKFFAFTAAHVIRGFGSATVLVPSTGKGGKLMPLPRCEAHMLASTKINDLDVAVIPLSADRLGPFRDHVFLEGTDIDQSDEPDQFGLSSFYFVLGYSASRTQASVSPSNRQIHQRSFLFSTGPVDPAEYQAQQYPQADHILLDFDHKEINSGGYRPTPPELQGVSGGGIFHIDRATNRGPLIAIATQNPRKARLIVGTRIKHFIQLARNLNV